MQATRMIEETLSSTSTNVIHFRCWYASFYERPRILISIRAKKIVYYQFRLFDQVRRRGAFLRGFIKVFSYLYFGSESMVRFRMKGDILLLSFFL